MPSTGRGQRAYSRLLIAKVGRGGTRCCWEEREGEEEEEEERRWQEVNLQPVL